MFDETQCIQQTCMGLWVPLVCMALLVGYEVNIEANGGGKGYITSAGVYKRRW